MSKFAFHPSIRCMVLTLTLLVGIGLAWKPAFSPAVCERSGVEFRYFNGVQTTDFQAKDVAEFQLPRQIGLSTPNGEPITYALYFNDSEGLSDFVETFDQRLQEQKSEAKAA